MTPSLPNAFSIGGTTPFRSLASAMSPLRANISREEYGWLLDLSPMRAAHALAAWPGFGENEHARWLVYDVEQTTWNDEHGRSLSLGEIATRLSIAVDAQFGTDQLVVDDASLIDLVSMFRPSSLHAARVDGPIELGDAKAMSRASALTFSPLDFEFRAVAAFEISDDRAVSVEARDRMAALAVVGENFRQYLGAIRRESADRFAAPEPWQLERLLSESGTITVRPIETEVFSTSIDVGICTSSEPDEPAGRSLIYDVPSDTWHDES